MGLITAIEANATAMQNSASKLLLLEQVNASILSAATAGAFTLTVDVSGALAQDALYVNDQLVQLKYTTDLGPKELVVNW